MQSKHSRTLGGIISRLAFDAERNNYTEWLADRLFLRVISSAGSCAERILSLLLKEWEIHRIKSRIAREIDTSTPSLTTPRGEFFATLSSRLETVAGVSVVLTTAHVLSLILEDDTTISSRVLAMYGITADEVGEMMFRVDDEDNPPAIISNSFTEPIPQQWHSYQLPLRQSIRGCSFCGDQESESRAQFQHHAQPPHQYLPAQPELSSLL